MVFVILLSFPDNTGSDYKYKSHLVDSETITFSNTVPPAQDFSVYYRQTIHILVPLRVLQFPAATSHNMDWSDLGKILPAVFLFCSPFYAFVSGSSYPSSSAECSTLSITSRENETLYFLFNTIDTLLPA